MVTVRPAALVAALVLGSAALAGCGLSDEVTLPTALPSASGDRPTPTRTLPSEQPSASLPTDAPTAAPSAEPSRPTESATLEPTSEAPTEEAPTSQAPEESPTPTRTLSQAATSIPPSDPAATESPTSEQPESPEPSEDPTTTTPEATESASETPSEAPSETSAAPTESSSPSVAGSASASAAPDESGSSSLPLWLGLGALVAAGGALAWFLLAGSRRRTWDERLEVERAQGQWVVAELVPALTNPATPAQMVGPHWASAQPTLDELEANVAGLVTDAPDETRAARARAIGTAVTQVRSSAAAHVALVGSGAADPQALAASAAAVQTARIQLANALGTTP